MKNYLLVPGLALLVWLAACNKDNDYSGGGGNGGNTVNFMASLSGASEVPAVSTGASGNATASYNVSTKVLSGSVSYSGLVPTMGHIHKAAAGVSGDVVFGFASLASPIYFSSPALSASQQSDLMANLYYINLHSLAYPNGEIRGQLIKQSSSSGN